MSLEGAVPDHGFTVKPLLPLCAALLAGLSAALSASAGRADEMVIPDVTYPRLPVQAAGADGFVPPGWTLEAQAKGDLNGDGVPDLAFVLHDADPKNVVANAGGLGADPLDTNPRILGVAFGIKGAGAYDLVLQKHALIPRRTEPSVEDPFDADSSLGIARGALHVTLEFFADAGTWMTSNTTETFRWQKGGFALIGYDRTETHRGSGEMHGVSINYPAGRAKRTHGATDSDKVDTSWETLSARPLLSLDQIGDGMAFDPDQPPKR